MRHLRHHTWGFSLIEVLVALTILAVGLAAIVKFQATVFGYSASAKERALAARLADEKIADLAVMRPYLPRLIGLPTRTSALIPEEHSPAER